MIYEIWYFIANVFHGIYAIICNLFIGIYNFGVTMFVKDKRARAKKKARYKRLKYYV